MPQVFEHIPHRQRKVFQRTTMKDIFLFFMYRQAQLVQSYIQLKAYLDNEKIGIVSDNIRDGGKIDNGKACLNFVDNDVNVSILSSGILVTVPAKEYRDFTVTVPVWNHIGEIMQLLDVAPTSWAFMKTNKFQFTQSIREEDRQNVLKLVLSPAFKAAIADREVYTQESIDKTMLFSCQYQFEKTDGKDSLSLKYMIATQQYSREKLGEQVIATNELMFDVWHWTMSDAILKFLDRPKK